MRLLAVTLRYPPLDVGGYEMMARDAVLGLRARGHEVSVLTGRGRALEGRPGVLPRLAPALDGDPEGDALRASTLEHLRLTFHRAANAEATRHALAETGAQALLWFDLSLASLAPLRAARRVRVPTLGLLADPWPRNRRLSLWRERSVKPLRRRCLSAAWRAWRRHVGLGRALVCSDYLRGVLVADGLPPADLPVLPLGLAPELEEAARGARPAARAPGEPLRCVCTSMLWHGKGQHVLLEAVRLARARGVPVELELAGAGRPEYVDLLERAIASGGLAGSVRLLGRLDAQAVARRYAAAHVLGMPSLWGEPFGRTTIEGMAFGLPVLGTVAGATPEIVREGREGHLVAPGDAGALAARLELLAADEPARARLGAAARERALGTYGHERFLGALEEELLRLVGEGAR